MSARAEAIAAANTFADATLREARGLLRDAIDYRRLRPHRFALFHRYMAAWRRARGHKSRARWHDYWEQRYTAKAWALEHEAALLCMRAHPPVA